MPTDAPHPGSPPNRGSTQPKSTSQSQTQRQRLLSWLNQHWDANRQACPICTATDWRITQVVELRQFQEGSFSFSGWVIPVIGVTCQTCGFVHWFNAMLTGVVAPEESPNASETPA